MNPRHGVLTQLPLRVTLNPVFDVRQLDVAASAYVSTVPAIRYGGAFMEYKTIMVHLDAHPRRQARLEIALKLAAKTGGHLIGLFSVNLLVTPRNVDGQWSAGLMAAVREQMAAACSQAQAEFQAVCAGYPDVRTEWREDAGGALEAATLSAGYADLVIAGQDQRDAEIDPRVGAHFAEDLVLAVPRPVLLIPYTGRFDSLGVRVLLAWNSSPQALHAATGAMPLLTGAKEVSVMVFDPEKDKEGHGEEPGADISLFLARHGVKASVSSQRSIDGDVGCAILSRAADMSADLIVMGAYGHSRTRERILGGATRTIFESMTVPVLMSH